ncbi:hypothetical protein WJX84_012389, partial [Apatococcus fuscideae]
MNWAGHESDLGSVQVYREHCAAGQPAVYISRHADSAAAYPLHGKPVLCPYGPLQEMQQRRLAARRHRTTFCFDFPDVFENALRGIWAGSGLQAPQGALVQACALEMAPGCSYKSAEPAVEAAGDRAARQEEGMVAWRLTLRTPEAPFSRMVVAIANDITFNSGAFGPREDAMFRAVTEYALQQKLPLVYLAANSGARVGLANEVKQCLQGVCLGWTFGHSYVKGHLILEAK